MVRVQTMTPDEYKLKHDDFKIIYAFHSSPFGDCLLGVSSTDKAIAHLSFVSKSKQAALTELKNDWMISELIEDSKGELDDMARKIFSVSVFTDDSVSILMKGTEFQIKVWEALQSIPPGTTSTYAQIASNIGKSKAVRAVGNAVMKNNIAYLVPCHRVVGKSGNNKYKWGTERKESILIYERKYVNT